ncbi:MAG: OadG family protein [Bacteroidales bacterium]|nr:OadG family protein [Bacteroidales bacterium]
MNSLILLQVSQSVIEKSADMAAKDPHGAIITLVSVSVVFVALVILYFAYTFVGKAVNTKISISDILARFRRKSAPTGKNGPTEEEAAAIALALDHELNGETYAAIGLALHQYLNDTVHDLESYIITIKRK